MTESSNSAAKKLLINFLTRATLDSTPVCSLNTAVERSRPDNRGWLAAFSFLQHKGNWTMTTATLRKNCSCTYACECRYEGKLRDLVGEVITLTIIVPGHFHGSIAGRVRIVAKSPAVWIGDFCFDFDTEVATESQPDGPNALQLYIRNENQ